ncbi:MAG TPA: hypothetical protein VK116_19155 [Planctomycetota bacterium]|nr:hypothetical protein [Planctomycetota bacterium]
MSLPRHPRLRFSAIEGSLAALWDRAWVRWLLFLIVFVATYLWDIPVAHAQETLAGG